MVMKWSTKLVGFTSKLTYGSSITLVLSDSTWKGIAGLQRATWTTICSMVHPILGHEYITAHHTLLLPENWRLVVQTLIFDVTRRQTQVWSVKVDRKAHNISWLSCHTESISLAPDDHWELSSIVAIAKNGYMTWYWWVHAILGGGEALA